MLARTAATSGDTVPPLTASPIRGDQRTYDRYAHHTYPSCGAVAAASLARSRLCPSFPARVPLSHVCGGCQTQFPPPLPGLYGWGTDYKPGPNNHWPFFIIDRLQVPLGLPSGDYVLSWRWDCEQGAQVWTTCGAPLACSRVTAHGSPQLRFALSDSCTWLARSRHRAGRSRGGREGVGSLGCVVCSVATSEFAITEALESHRRRGVQGRVK